MYIIFRFTIALAIEIPCDLVAPDRMSPLIRNDSQIEQNKTRRGQTRKGTYNLFNIKINAKATFAFLKPLAYFTVLQLTVFTRGIMVHGAIGHCNITTHFVKKKANNLLACC